MPDTPAPIEIPDRASFKASEVCELLKLQPYVLRSWESEFPGLGVAKTTGGPRVYRRSDVEQAIRIRHLLMVEGLTLAGARRRIEDDATTPELEASTEGVLDGHTRERLVMIRQGLRSILEMLGSGSAAPPFQLTTPIAAAEQTAVAVPGSRRAAGKTLAAGAGAPASPRRKRSA